VQIRGDFGWAYPSGSVLGFRFTGRTEREISSGVINGQNFDDFEQTVYETYRFYYQHAICGGGYSDWYAGWSDDNHAVLGADFDVPIAERLAVQSGFTYLLSDDNANNIGDHDAWNLHVGVVWRPQGRCWYRSYDRPILPVADNGSMIIRRENQPIPQ
jgi:hypothetical protein